MLSGEFSETTDEILTEEETPTTYIEPQESFIDKCTKMVLEEKVSLQEAIELVKDHAEKNFSRFLSSKYPN